MSLSPRLDAMLARTGPQRTLLPLFLVVTAGVVVAIALILGRVSQDTIRDEALEQAERTATTFADFTFEDDEFRDGVPTREGLEDLDDLITASQTISMVRVVAPSGEILYASERDPLESSFADLDDLAAALAGDPTTEITSFAREGTLDEEAAEGGTQELVEVNVPIGSGPGGRGLAALAVYTPYRPVADQIADTTRTTNFVLGGAGLALYLLLIPSLRRASRNVARGIDPEKALTQRRLARAIVEGQLVLHYQPKVDAGRRTVTGVEALVRWEDPERGLIPPNEFLPAAEAGPVINDLTLHVFELACAQAVKWRGARTEPRIAINLSAKNLLEDTLPDRFGELLAAHDLTADAFILEVTESVVMEDVDGSRRVLERLSDMGFGIAVDDFGTGHSSLVRLERLPIDELKIDREFVFALAAGGKPTLVRAIIGIAHELGLTVVAEGVEDERTLKRLRDEGCDQIQGFHVCRPVAADDLEDWLAEQAVTPSRAAQRTPAPV